jgi:hypothetical protein
LAKHRQGGRIKSPSSTGNHRSALLPLSEFTLHRMSKCLIRNVVLSFINGGTTVFDRPVDASLQIDPKLHHFPARPHRMQLGSSSIPLFPSWSSDSSHRISVLQVLRGTFWQTRRARRPGRGWQLRIQSSLNKQSRLACCNSGSRPLSPSKARFLLKLYLEVRTRLVRYRLRPRRPGL